MINKSRATAPGFLLIAIINCTCLAICACCMCCSKCLAFSFKHGPKPATVASTEDWQSEQEMGLESARDGHFEEAEKNFLKARKNLLREYKTAPPSSFSARWFPLQDALRSLYFSRAEIKENSLPFAKVDECYRKGLRIPGTSYEMWERYADFLRRKGKAKQAEKVEKEGKKKSLYTTNPQ
jgi:hypothetical protein